MSKNLDLARSSVAGGAIRADGDATRFAVAVTDEELITAKAGLFAKKIERFPLKDLAGMRQVPNPSTNLLQLEFNGTVNNSLVIMYEPRADADFRRIVAVLEQHLPAGAQ